MHAGRPAASDWTDGDELGAVERIMLLERDAALASSVRTAAHSAGLGQSITAVMGAPTLGCSVRVCMPHVLESSSSRAVVFGRV